MAAHILGRIDRFIVPTTAPGYNYMILTGQQHNPHIYWGAKRPLGVRFKEHLNLDEAMGVGKHKTITKMHLKINDIGKYYEYNDLNTEQTNP